MRDVEIPNWLKELPLAPEFRPTDTEFADPIAYISKIEKEASAFGICKVIPPLPKPSKKYVLTNLNKSLSKCPELGNDVCSLPRLDNVNKVNDGARAAFTTRHQELGRSGKRTKGASQPLPPAVHKQVWQSGEIYTLEQFESKSKTFARSQLGVIKEVSPLVIETLFWRAACEKPIYIEYANDVPGSGFGEPEGPCRFRHRRRRRRTFNRNNQGCSAVETDQVNKTSNYDEKKGESTCSPNSSVETPKKDTSSLNMSDRVHRQKGSNDGNEMEGTSGWKLANSPWNLQVIARSPGSLTRFMPDDIPGVTSPMVYIGMLFSWFAWHVEDHELHSLNFLHMGAPKTWYSVPGDYALTFEEVIRTQAYGGAIDRLAALTLLGEKTTLLSPEAIVASGIPCCRLVQNPGEFVVTFPRAYHIGFSHGFNCGEAANFGTPKWLTVAKDAAVRRAAMNYLPMLSHQQLLYLLTMSFISRVPRSLLPGVRGSRLRDRQKEERELLVKTAFVEDLLNENKLLTSLLQRSSCYQAVLWDLESLPSSIKESDLRSAIAAVMTTPNENVHFDDDQNQDLFSHMSLYVETVNDPYINDDDISSDFQVDSGTLPCVACGVLGFPFMSVLQPSEKAMMDIIPTEQYVVRDLGNQNPMASHFPSHPNSMAEDSISDELDVGDKSCKDKICSDHPNVASSKFKPIQSTCLDDESVVSASLKKSPDSSEANFDKGWNTSNGYLRPRIFCLEHACKIEQLLRSKGGAKLLIICHSDFQKIKAQAAAVAEQIGSPFRYNEIQLDNASPDDLNLINLAIDDEQQDERVEDWTSKLNINLRQCVKNKSSSGKIQHALGLDALFANTSPSAGALILQWQARKSRSKRNLNHPVHSKPSKSSPVQKDVVLEAKSDGHMERKECRIIQYSRRTVKPKPRGSATDLGKSAAKENSSLELGVLAPIEKYELQQENQNHVTTRDLGENSFPSQVVENVKEQIENDIRMQSEINNDNINSEQNDKCHSENSAGSPPVSVRSIESTESEKDNQIMEEISMTNETSDLVTEISSGGQCNIEANGDVLMQEGLELPISVESCADKPVVGCSDKETDQRFVECVNLNDRLQHEIQVTNSGDENNHVSSIVTSMKESIPLSVEEDCSSPDKRELDSTNSKVHQKSTSRNGSSKRKRGVELQRNEQCGVDGFIRSPCEGLRPRGGKDTNRSGGIDRRTATVEEPHPKKKVKNASDGKISNKNERENRKGSHKCDLQGCKLSFQTKGELQLHKRNRCPHEGCGKKFSSHKYAVLHFRVHEDDRPLKCPWKGCKMTFKWAWARTEHLRVHTGERPYKCKVERCGLTFRFVSDFSRHRRKTGHYVNVPALK